MNSIASINEFSFTQSIQTESAVWEADHQWIDWIDEAAVLENIDLERASAVYEKAGRLCLTLFERDIAADGLHPCLVAGLCFEKSAATAGLVHQTYRDVLFSFKEYHRQEIAPIRDSNSIVGFIFAAPFYLEATFASLKFGSRRIFLELMRDQVHWLASLCQSFPDGLDTENSDPDFIMSDTQTDTLCAYLQAIINITGEIVGSHHPEYLAMQDTAANVFRSLEEKGFEVSFTSQLQMEANLSSIYMDWENITVKEMLRRFTDNEFPEF